MFGENDADYLLTCKPWECGEQRLRQLSLMQTHRARFLIMVVLRKGT